jgi:hypothetical protein
MRQTKTIHLKTGTFALFAESQRQTRQNLADNRRTIFCLTLK